MSDLIRSLVANISELICIDICSYECNSSSVTSGTKDKRHTRVFFKRDAVRGSDIRMEETA